jgi:hypothetical protein
MRVNVVVLNDRSGEGGCGGNDVEGGLISFAGAFTRALVVANNGGVSVDVERGTHMYNVIYGASHVKFCTRFLGCITSSTICLSRH